MDNLDSNFRKYKNYSKEDGNILNKSNLNNLNLEKIENSNCNNCDFENEQSHNYCKNCGEILYKVKRRENEERLNNKTKIIKNINNTLNIVDKKKVIFTSLVSILILLVVSLVIKFFMSIGKSQLDAIINPMHIILAFNLGNLHGYASSMLGSGLINIRLGLLAVLIVPIVSLFISNMIFMRKERKDSKGLFIDSIAVGLSYSLMLLFISLISNLRLSFNDMLQYGMSLNVRYSYLSVLFNGFLIGFLSTYWIGFNKGHKKENNYFYLLKQAINTVLIGYFIVFIMIFILSLSNVSFLSEIGIYGYSDTISLSIILSQVSSYIWSFANFIPVILNNQIISVLSMISSGLFFNTKLILYSTMAISFIILLIMGCIIKHRYKENDIKPIIIFSLFYAITMGILALFSSINVDGNISLIQMNSYKSSIYMGSNLFITITLSFLYSCLVSALGYKLYTKE